MLGGGGNVSPTAAGEIAERLFRSAPHRSITLWQLQFQWLEWRWHGFVFGVEQSRVNHDERADYRECGFHSESGSGDRANKSGWAFVLRLMALPTPPRKAFRGMPVQATRLPQLPRRAVEQAFSTSGPVGVTAKPSHILLPHQNTTYTAKFNTQYYLTMSHNTGGKVTPASGWKTSGATISISATPSSGYNFTNWTGTGTGSYSGTNNPASIIMNGPITEAAAFSQNSTPTPTP